MPERGALDDAELVSAARTGDTDAFGGLFERWFDRSYDVARNVVRDPDAAADVAQDAFVRAWTSLGSLEDPHAFGGWLLRITRNGALDRLRREQRSRPMDGDIVTGLHDRGAPDAIVGRTGGPGLAEDPADAALTTEREDLLDAASVALGERDASLLDLHLRHGLTPAEIASELGVAPNTAHQQLFRMRERLGAAIGGLLLWQRGRPRCPDLAASVPVASPFDAALLSNIDRHQRSCSVCTDDRRSMTAASQLFSALPIAIAPAALRLRAADGLRAHGVAIETGTTADPTSITPAARQPAPPASPTPAMSAAGTTPAPGMADSEPTADPTLTADEHTASRRTRRRAAIALGALVVLMSGAVTVLVVADNEPDTVTTSPLVSSPEASAAAMSTVAPEATSAATPPTVSSSPTTAAPTTSTSAPSSTASPGLAPDDGPAGDAADPEPDLLPPPPPVAQPPLAPVPPAPPPPVPPPRPPATTTTTSPTPPPVIVRFTVRALPPGLICGSGSPHEFFWTSLDADRGELTIGGVTRIRAASDTVNLCAISGAIATIVVSGPGGSTERAINVP